MSEKKTRVSTKQKNITNTPTPTTNTSSSNRSLPTNSGGTILTLSSQCQFKLQEKEIFQVAAVVFLVVVLFANSLRGKFTYDDHLALTMNADSHADSNIKLWDILQHDYWGNSLRMITSIGSFRPLTVLTFRFQHWLSGFTHSAFALRAVNIFISILNGIWVHILARVYFPNFNSSNWLHRITPTLAMLLFMLHPVHIESVVSIVGRAELLYCFFGFCSLFCLHQFLILQEKYTDGNKKQVKKRYYTILELFWMLPVPFFMLLSVLSKESGITFAALFIVHAVILYRRGWTSKRKVIIICIFSPLLVFSYLALRSQHIGAVYLASSRLLRRTENPQYFVPPGIFNWLMVRWIIQIKNLELLFFPTQLCCEYSYNCIPIINSMNDSRIPFMCAITILILTLILKNLWGLFYKIDTFSLSWIVSFLWIAIPYAPVSHLFVRFGTFIAERCLYVPSIGAVLIIVYSFTWDREFQSKNHNRKENKYEEEEEEENSQERKMWRAKSERILGFSILLILAIIWGYTTSNRINDWYDDESLFRSAIKVCPDSGKSHYNLAIAIIEKESKTFSNETVSLLKKAYALDNQFKEPLYLLAVYAYNEENNPHKALSLLREYIGSPYTMKHCYEVYSTILQKVYPNMTKWEEFEDNANIVSTPEEKATQYRLAGLVLLGVEKDTCKASKDLKKSLELWNISGLYWFTDRVQWGTSGTFCDTLYFYAKSIGECFTTSKMNKNLFNDLIVEAASFIDNALMYCYDEWDKVPISDIKLYYHRPSHFNSISAMIYEVMMNRLLPVVSGNNEVAQVVRHAAATAAVRQYCYLASLLNSDSGKLISYESDSISHARSFFHRKRASLLEHIVDSLTGLRLKSNGEDELKTLLKCTPELLGVLNLS